MSIKSVLNKLKENNQEESMLGRFLKWRNKEPSCKVCHTKGIDSEFLEGLCYDCYYSKLLKEKKEMKLKRPCKKCLKEEIDLLHSKYLCLSCFFAKEEKGGQTK